MMSVLTHKQFLEPLAEDKHIKKLSTGELLSHILKLEKSNDALDQYFLIKIKKEFKGRNIN